MPQSRLGRRARGTRAEPCTNPPAPDSRLLGLPAINPTPGTAGQRPPAPLLAPGPPGLAPPARPPTAPPPLPGRGAGERGARPPPSPAPPPPAAPSQLVCCSCRQRPAPGPAPPPTAGFLRGGGGAAASRRPPWRLLPRAAAAAAPAPASINQRRGAGRGMQEGPLRAAGSLRAGGGGGRGKQGGPPGLGECRRPRGASPVPLWGLEGQRRPSRLRRGSAARTARCCLLLSPASPQGWGMGHWMLSPPHPSG